VATITRNGRRPEMRSRRLRNWVGVSVVLASGIAHSGIVYNRTTETIEVFDFPQQTPCTLAKICEADEAEGWGRASYEKETDTYTVTANLLLKTVNGDAYFRIGSKQHPHVVLVIAGNLDVEYSTARLHKVHVRIGDPVAPNIKPTVRIRSSERGEHGMDLEHATCEIFNSVVTADDPEKRFGRITVGPIVWKNSQFSHFAHHVPDWGGSRAKSVIENCRFSHGGTSYYQMPGYRVIGCTFEGLSSAVGATMGVSRLVRCHFKDNTRNFYMGMTGGDEGRLYLIECKVEPSKKGDTLCINEKKDGTRVASKLFMQYPLRLEVVDDQEDPIEDALLDVMHERAAEELPKIDNAESVTDEDGFSPEEIDRAIMLTDYVLTATCTRKEPYTEPQRNDYTYCLKVRADGYKEKAIKGIDPDESWYGKDVHMNVVLEGE